MRKIQIITFQIVICLIHLYPQKNQEYNTTLYKNDNWEFSIKMPENWEISTDLVVNDNSHMIVKAETQNCSISVGITDYYTDKLKEANTISRSSLAATLQQQDDELIQLIIEEIQKNLKASEIENKSTYISDQKAHYIMYKFKYENEIPLQNEQYFLFDNAIMYTITISKTDETTTNEKELLNQALSSFSMIKKNKISNTKPIVSESLFKRLAKAAFRGASSSIILSIPIAIISGLFVIIRRKRIKRQDNKQAEWIKRRKKVWESTNLEELKQIVINDPEESVRDAALDRIQELEKQ